MRKSILNKKKPEIINLYKEGRTIKSISLETGVPENYIREIVKESEGDEIKLLDRRGRAISKRR